MSETPLATMSQDGEDGEKRPASTEPATDETISVDTAPAISDADYDAIAAAVMETERGRWFLKEYARRNRNADTQTVLTALERLEDRIGVTADSNGDTSVALISHNVIDLAEAITQVKREVQDLGGNGEDKDHFNSATVELEAIVSQTETATGEILEAAEKIQEVLWTLREEGANETQCDIIESKIIDVYTACSFQDLTGQRSSKVVRLVGYVEKRVTAMMDILGLTSSEQQDRAENATRAESQSTADSDAGEAYQEGDKRSDAHLLHGPALDGEAIEQDDVDALFGTAAPVDAAPMNNEDDVDTVADADDGFSAATIDADDGAEHAGEDLTAKADAADEEVSDEEPELSDMERDLARLEDEARSIAEEATEAEDDEEESSANIITDDMVVEIHDAEILRQPAEEALMGDALAKPPAAPDIFEVDSLDFDGPDMAERSVDQLSDEIELSRQSPRDDKKMIVEMPDDFAVDEGAADMFVDAVGEDTTEADTGLTSEPSKAAAAQDIFDVDDFGVDEFEGASADPSEIADPADAGDDESQVTMVATAPEEEMLDEALAQAAMESIDAEGDETPAESPSDDELDGKTAGQAAQAVSDEDALPYTDEERIALFS